MKTDPRAEANAPFPIERRDPRRGPVVVAVLGGIVVLGILAAIVFELPGMGTATRDPRSDIGSLRVVDGAAQVRVDVRHRLSASAAGLPDNSDKMFGPFHGIALQVEFVAPDGPKRIFVDSMHVSTRDGWVRSIATSTHNHGYLFLRTQLAALSVLGFSTKQVADFENAMPNGAGDKNSYFTLPFGTGSALGVPTSVTVSCEGAKGCTVSTMTVLRST